MACTIPYHLPPVWQMVWYDDIDLYGLVHGVVWYDIVHGMVHDIELYGMLAWCGTMWWLFQTYLEISLLEERATKAKDRFTALEQVSLQRSTQDETLIAG